MNESHSLGAKGEQLAAEYLQKKGYTIRERNWRSGKQEIDIVAEDNGFIVFAEVKARGHSFRMHPRDAVTREKQRSMLFAAERYIRAYNINKESRFDIITIIDREDMFDIEHIENAFYPTLK